MRGVALLGAVFAFALAFAPTCAIQGCALHHPVDVWPDYPSPEPLGVSASRDAGRE